MADHEPDESDADTLPQRVVDEATRLTRLARASDKTPATAEADKSPAVAETDQSPATAETDQSATEINQYITRRDDLLRDHGFTARIREEDTRTVLVLHPEEWHDEGVIRTDRIEDLSRAAEIPLDGVGDPDDWAEIDAANRTLVAEVRDEHGAVHGATAAAFADFMGNHYARRIESATSAHIEEFCTEYFVRNAWPSSQQKAVLEKSIQLLFETAGEPVPTVRRQ